MSSTIIARYLPLASAWRPPRASPGGRVGSPVDRVHLRRAPGPYNVLNVRHIARCARPWPRKRRLPMGVAGLCGAIRAMQVMGAAAFEPATSRVGVHGGRLRSAGGRVRRRRRGQRPVAPITPTYRPRLEAARPAAEDSNARDRRLGPYWAHGPRPNDAPPLNRQVGAGHRLDGSFRVRRGRPWRSASPPGRRSASPATRRR